MLIKNVTSIKTRLIRLNSSIPLSRLPSIQKEFVEKYEYTMMMNTISEWNVIAISERTTFGPNSFDSELNK